MGQKLEHKMGTGITLRFKGFQLRKMLASSGSPEYRHYTLYLCKLPYDKG